ncbi:MAG TPA: hypothetical protein VK819_05605 [Acidobacteriaceae bacterium]|jgi:hypothetical protein|nr:hypothetical protein [Acidobacteriaceae bacterium]
MQSARLFSSIAFLVAAPLVTAPVASAQQPAVPAAAPIPAPILSAHTVFLANGGADGPSTNAFKRAGMTNEPYASVYPALETWGHWTLVSSPDSADLILTVRFISPYVDFAEGNPMTYAPELDLSIADSKTHTQLWVITEVSRGAFKKATWDKNYAESVDRLMTQLKALVTPATP